jgi:hypothetical protein
MRARFLMTAACAAVAFLPCVIRAQVFTQAEREAILDAHNQVRCAVTPAAQVMPPLAWDAALEATAQAWAMGCQDGLPDDHVPGLIDHNPDRSDGHRFGYVGENIAGSRPGPMSPTRAVQLWAEESAQYDFTSNTCSGVCGHYTQVVWATTRFVGCARWHCSDLTYPSSIVCDYGPGGNNGQRPYQAGSGVNGACDLIFQDGLEFGNLLPWSSAQTDGDLSVTVAAGLAGTRFGLQALVDDTAGLFVVDETPADESRYRARFYFDPNGFDPGELQLHFRTRIFIAFEEGPTSRLATIVLRRIAGLYSLMARVRLDDGTRANTPFVNISDGPHAIEIDWRRATAPGANDGSFQMWIDGNLAASLAALDNSASAVDFVRLGALSVKTGASGTMYWDEFESREQSFIGGLP